MTQGSTDSDERTGANSMIKWFLLADGAYIGLFGLYVCEQWAWLGWVIRVIGPVLIFLIPFLIDDKSWRIKCALLACVPIVGDVTFTILSDQQDKARAEKTFIRTEARLDEVFSTDPGDTAANIEGAGTGCEAKATFLAFEAGVAEAALAAQEPALAPAIFSQTGNLSARMQFYDTLPDILERGAGGPAANSLALAQKVQTLLRRQSAYLKLAETIRGLKSDYDEVIRLNNAGETDAAREQLLQIALKLEAQTDLSSAAGYYNHLAMIHEGCDQLDDALKDISNGIEVDGDHFPLYETQAYVSWIKTHGGLASLGMAEKGLELAKGLPAKVQNDYASMQQNYDAVIRSQPGLAGVASARRKEIEDQYPAIFDQIKKYSDYFVANFKLDVAYFSALEQTNEAEARQFASDLTVANISDVDYRDCRGLVTMMFSNDNLDDLGHAQSDFKFAVENARILPDFINGKPSNDLILLCFHYQECQRRVAALNSP